MRLTTSGRGGEGAAVRRRSVSPCYVCLCGLSAPRRAGAPIGTSPPSPSPPRCIVSWHIYVCQFMQLWWFSFFSFLFFCAVAALAIPLFFSFFSEWLCPSLFLVFLVVVSPAAVGLCAWCPGTCRLPRTAAHKCMFPSLFLYM